MVGVCEGRPCFLESRKALGFGVPAGGGAGSPEQEPVTPGAPGARLSGAGAGVTPTTGPTSAPPATSV